MKEKIGIMNLSDINKMEAEIKKSLVLIGLVLLFSPLFADWGNDYRLTYDDSVSYAALNNARSVAAHGDTLHVVWYDRRDGNFEIYYKRSTDRGTTWPPTDTRLTNAPDSSQYPSVAVSGNDVHVVWIDYRDGNNELYYKHSTDGGLNWSPDTGLTNDNALSWRPSNAVSGDTVHVVWEDGRGVSSVGIYYKRSTDGGTTWGNDRLLSDSLYYAARPSVAVSGNSVHVVWFDLRNGNLDIYYRGSTDGGTNWGPDKRLTDDPGNSVYCSVAASGNNVYALWSDWRDGAPEVHYSRSTDGGTTWGDDTRLTYDPDSSMLPSVAVSGDNVHVAWYDNRDGNYEIYYKCSTDGGATWQADTGLTSDTARSAHPSVIVSGSCVYVIWDDGRDGNREIYYKRNPTGNPGVEETHTFETAEEILLISPTVFKNSIILKFKESSSEPLQMVLYNVYGASVFERSYSHIPHSLIIEDVRINRLPSSVYFLSVSSNKRIIALVKLIKL